MQDLISRQDAVECVYKALRTPQLKGVLTDTMSLAIRMVDDIPSAQPDIIHCGECKHRDPEDHKCDCGHDILWQLPRQDGWYCADAERKEGEADAETEV